MVPYQSTDANLHSRLSKFANIVAKNFGIEILFDQSKAKMNDKTISLPSINGMTERDVDLMICATLHQIGHIRFSNYAEVRNFIKTENHFRIVNSVDDSRCENLMMKEYDGAHDMFDKLYNDFGRDHAYMRRVFGFDPMKCDMWYYVGIYVHHFLIKIENKPSIESIYGTKHANKIEEIVKKTKIDQYMTSVSLKTWKDAVEVGTHLYQKIESIIGDKSKKLDIAKAEEAKEKVLKDLHNVREKLDTIMKTIAYSEKRINSMRDEIIASRKERSNNLKNERKTKQKAQNDFKPVREAIRRHNKANKIRTAAWKFDAKKKEIEAKIAELLEKQKSQSTKQIISSNKRIEKMKHRASKFENLFDQKHSEANNVSRLSFDKEKLNKMHKDWSELCDKIWNAKQKIRQLKGKTNAEIEYEKHQQTIKSSKEEMSSDMKELKDIANKAKAAGLPAIQGLPGLSFDSGWSESDDAQQSFDDDATESHRGLVVGGREFGIGTFAGNGQKIIDQLDNVTSNVKEFNVLEYFAHLATDDKLDSLNDLSNSLSYDDSQIETEYVETKHVPSTVMFDTTIRKERSNCSELTKILFKHRSTIENVKRIFKKKFKYSRRDKFVHNQTEGLIDTRTIWQVGAKLDNDRLFERIDPKFISDNVASILVDISGSLDKIYTNHGDKLKEIAYFISEGLKSVHVEHQILGAHAPICQEMIEQDSASIYNRRSNRLETIIYKDFTNTRNDGCQNISIEASDNSDGEHLRTTAKGLMKYCNKQKIIFYITDGKPFLNGANLDVLDSDLIRTMKWLTANKVKVFAIGFNEGLKKFYSNYCNVSDYDKMLKFFNEKL